MQIPADRIAKRLSAAEARALSKLNTTRNTRVVAPPPPADRIAYRA